MGNWGSLWTHSQPDLNIELNRENRNEPARGKVTRTPRRARCAEYRRTNRQIFFARRSLWAIARRPLLLSGLGSAAGRAPGFQSYEGSGMQALLLLVVFPEVT